MKINLYLIILSLFFCLRLFGGQTAAPLVIGMELSYPPFETIDKSGNASGISVDLAHALGKFLERPIRIENIPFIGLIPSLKTKKIDLIISSLTITKEREKTIAFSDPYLEIGLAMLVAKKSTLEFPEELNKKERVIVVKQGTTAETYANQFLDKATVLILASESSCVLEVVQGKADAFIYDQFSIYIQWQRNQATTKALLKPFYKQSWGIGLRKNETQLKDEVNAFLIDFKKKKGMEKLIDKCLPKAKKEFQTMKIPFFI